MTFDVIFLGTGGSVPSKKRTLPCTLVRREDELVMFDCGEGTQKQFLMARVGVNRPMCIFLTHMHADHVLGLPGIFQTFSFLGRSRPLTIYGPPGTRYFANSINRAVRFRSMFPLHVQELHAGQVVKTGKYSVTVGKADHSIPCLAFSLEEHPKLGKFNPSVARTLGVPEGPLWRKLQLGHPVRVKGRVIKPTRVVGPQRRGAKIVYAIDTRPCRSVAKLASGADLLIHDATFAHADAERAREYGHSTCTQAAALARKARARRLALVHTSAMYEDTTPLLQQARRVFAHSFLPADLTRLTAIG